MSYILMFWRADVKWNGNTIIFVYKIALIFPDRSNLVRNEMHNFELWYGEARSITSSRILPQIQWSTKSTLIQSSVA